MENCVCPHKCPFYQVIDHRHYCDLQHQYLWTLVNPILCESLIHYHKNEYGGRV